eukprot:m51a1_g14710 putative abc transporter (472) ;mRNA; r:153529-155615
MAAADVEMARLPALEPQSAAGPPEEPFGKVRLQTTEHLVNDAATIVSLRNVHKTYLLGIEGVPALRGVSVNIKRGEFVCVYGTSGGGKTTLLNIVGTIDRPTKGELFLCGTHITPRTPDKVLSQIRLQHMGFVFQTFNLLSALTALENVELPMILLGDISARERRRRAMELLQSVGMARRAHHLPSQLSGGEQQRVTIARAMANNPELLLLDEPTGDLDTVNTAIVLKLLSSLNKEKGITMLMVTHDMSLKHFADRVIWMRDGLIQRIEEVSEGDRMECMAKLEAKLLTGPAQQNVATEFRDPTFYAPHAYMLRMQQRQKMQSIYGQEEQALRLISQQRKVEASALGNSGAFSEHSSGTTSTRPHTPHSTRSAAPAPQDDEETPSHRHRKHEHRHHHHHHHHHEHSRSGSSSSSHGSRSSRSRRHEERSSSTERRTVVVTSVEPEPSELDHSVSSGVRETPELAPRSTERL